MKRGAVGQIGVRTALVYAIGLGASGLGVVGCAGDGGPGRAARTSDAPRAQRVGDGSGIEPFLPTSMRVYPLTRIDRESGSDTPMAVFHFELKDRWGDGVKAAGVLRVQLYRPSGGLLSGVEVLEREWVIEDFAEPDTNARLFDPATRTYRVQLTGFPEWAEAFVRSGAEGGEASARPREGVSYLKLRAVFSTWTASNEDVFLQDEFVIQ